VTPTQQPKWRRLIQKVNYWFTSQDSDVSQFMLSFTHQFSYAADQVTYFAFSTPFSYEESVEQMDSIQKKFAAQPNLYFARDTLCYSLEQRKMEVYTISSTDGILPEKEEKPDPNDNSVFPDGVTSRKFKNKKVIFLTSRVHPGETPGSHTLNGFIQLLTE
jgi:cytosolic carboxypeptidase protein 5